jgi:membrane-associated phospholipid phosphatase
MSISIANPGTLAIGLGAIAVLTLPVVLYLHEKKKYYVRDSLLTVFWAFFFTLMLGYPVTLAARLGVNIPLQDLRFEQWDSWLGIHVSDIHAWALTHWFGMFEEKCYLQLFTFMQIAILLPIFTGRLKSAQSFIVSNLVAFAIGLPFFALLPGIDPWYAGHFMAVPDAEMCKSFVLLAIRQPGPYLYQYPAGAICFPSFHVIWAMLSVQAFWGFRWLRVPACLFATLIVVSTITTGNHYFVDVIAGILVAAVAMLIADRISGSFIEHRAPSLWFRRA